MLCVQVVTQVLPNCPSIHLHLLFSPCGGDPSFFKILDFLVAPPFILPWVHSVCSESHLKPENKGDLLQQMDKGLLASG